MATLTVQGVTDALRSVCGSPAAQGIEGAPIFREELNLALPRLYNMGMWRDLLFEHTVSTEDGTFTIPDHAESIIAALLDPTGDTVDHSYPQRIRSQFHDYNIVGRNDRTGENTLSSFGIVDDGYTPTENELKPISDITPASQGYYLIIVPSFPNLTLPTTVSNSRKVTLVFRVKAGIKTETFNLDGQQFLSGADSDVSEILEVKTQGVDLGQDVNIVAYRVTTDPSQQELTLSGTTVKQGGGTGSFNSTTTITIPVANASSVKAGDFISFDNWDAQSDVDISAVPSLFVVSGVDTTSTPNNIFVSRSTSAAITWNLVGSDGASGKIYHYDTTQLATVRQQNKVSRYRRYRVDTLENQKSKLRLLLKRKFTPLLDQDDLVHISSLNAIKHALLGNTAEENADLERANYHWGVCRAILDEQLDAHRGAAKPAVRIDPSGSGGVLLNMM
tara:strand:- start:77 stop:1417 length:1341 start_codon:yes stop_codon:yes gene_type:complete